MVALDKQVEFLVKLRDASQMLADAANEYLETLAPKEIKQENAVAEETFTVLKFEGQQGAKLGAFEIANKQNSDAAKWQIASDILNKASATIKDRYHGKTYAYSYWLYGEGKIYRQKLKE